MRLRPASLLLCAALALPAAAEPRILLVEDPADAGSQKLAALLRDRFTRENTLARLISLSPDLMSDPIAKGRLIASLEAAKVVVMVGATATDDLGREVQGTPVYFVGAAQVRGAVLSSPNVSGTLSFSADDILGAMPESWRRGLGVLYTPGYESVVRQIQEAARSWGGSLRERRIDSPKELSATVRELLAASPAVWMLGDPVLSEGAGFDYLVEASLSRDVPLIGSDPAQVRGGAVYCAEDPPGLLAQQAASDVARLLAKQALQDRLRLAPPGGVLYYRPALAKRFGLSTPNPPWQPIQ